MSGQQESASETVNFLARLLYCLAAFLVILGMINAMPGIPGLDQWAEDIAGNSNFIIRKFPYARYRAFEGKKDRERGE